MGAVRFIRKAGRVIPLTGRGGARAFQVGHNAGKIGGNAIKGAALGAGAVGMRRADTRRKSLGERIFPIKVNKVYDNIGLGLSLGSGALAAATFHSGIKGFVGGQLLTHGIDAVGLAANTASVAGHGRVRARAEQGVKQEARNFVLGNGVYFAGVMGQKKTWQGIRKGAQTLGKAAKWTGRLLKYNLMA